MNDLSGLKSVTEEILGEEELVRLLSEGEILNHYIGFEISGLVHLGQGILTGLVIRELQKLGIHTRIYLADWHTWINDKLNGDMDLINKVANEYFGPAMKIAAQIAGADPEKIEFIQGTNLYHNNDKYWQTLVEVSKNLTLSRVRKSTTILGREDSDNMEFAKLIYPPMQVADIFEMKCHIAHAGMDQRKCHVLAIEVANKLKINPLKDSKGNILKPIAIHHSLVAGLQKPAEWPLPDNIDKKEFLSKYKMSKSIAGSAVFIQDSEEEIKDKIRKAFAPEKEIGYNPVLNWVKNIILPITGELTVEREDRFGGTFTVKTYQELEDRYASGDLFPLDLKNNVARILIEILKPARDRFADPESQKLIEAIKDIKKTR